MCYRDLKKNLFLKILVNFFFEAKDIYHLNKFLSSYLKSKLIRKINFISMLYYITRQILIYF